MFTRNTSKLITLFFIAIFPLLLAAQEKQSWHGFRKEVFKVDTAQAYIVVPEKPLPGNPWLWRSYSPEFHVEIDSILVTKGFHLAFLNVNSKELYGQPALMTIWDQFYDQLVKEKKFSPWPALEGAVRGSLCEFAWAKKHPDRVSCIYSENPVSEIRSWPGGILKDAAMKGTGNADNWKQLLKAYNFTEEQALAYKDNPKDNLEQLALQRVPFYFTFGLKDAMMPMEENALVIANNYIKLGGPVTMHPMILGKQEANGHHVTIENPESIATFIVNSWKAKKQQSENQ